MCECLCCLHQVLVAWLYLVIQDGSLLLICYYSVVLTKLLKLLPMAVISTGLQVAPVIVIPVDGPWLMWTVPIGVGLSHLMWHSCVLMGGPTEGAAALLAVPAMPKLCLMSICSYLVVAHC
jgi:hypothetical protein